MPASFCSLCACCNPYASTTSGYRCSLLSTATTFPSKESFVNRPRISHHADLGCLSNSESRHAGCNKGLVISLGTLHISALGSYKHCQFMLYCLVTNSLAPALVSRNSAIFSCIPRLPAILRSIPSFLTIARRESSISAISRIEPSHSAVPSRRY